VADRYPHPSRRRAALRKRGPAGAALLFLLLLACPLPRPAAAEAAPVLGVIYPDISQPYRAVFTEILGGIRAAAPGRVVTLRLADDVGAHTVSGWAHRNDVQVIVALGRSGYRLGRRLRADLPTVFGAVLIPPTPGDGKPTGISLVPSPRALFARLHALSPRTRRVFVVYDPNSNASLIALARRAAADQGLELVALAAPDTRTAVHRYRDILDRRAHSGDAIWLPQDTVTVNDGVVLPMILEKAWEKDLVVFSSNPSYVQRGVLFSLYPDNQQMGRELARLALSRLEQGGSDAGGGMQPLTALRVAVNTRTADHLQLNLSRQEISGFDLVFPSR